MTDLREEPEGAAPHDGPPGMPRWVKVSALVVGLVVVVLVILQVAGVGPSHGPQLHGG